MSNKKGISIVFPFRSFHNQEFNGKVCLFFLLPPFFNLIILANLNQIMQAWGYFIQYGLSKLTSSGTVIYTEYSIFHVEFFLPSIVLSANTPSAALYGYTLSITAVLFLLTFLIKNTYMPVKFFLRSFIALIWFTQFYFYVHPTGFPYDIAIYTKSGFLQILALLLATPWIYCLTYYVYSYRVVSKVALTILVLNYLIILAPFQYLLNAVLIHQFSLLFMPVLYFFSGLLINILSIVAFYAYGISMEHKYPKYKRIG